MILLTSLIYALLFFVIPLQVGLVFLAGQIGNWWIEEHLWLGIFNLAAYVLIFLGVALSKGAYEFFEGYREAHFKRLKPYLNLRGSRWINLVGLILVGAGTLFFFFQGLLPLPFFFLFLATLLGLGDVFHKDELLVWKRPLPEPLEEKTLPLPKDLPEGMEEWKREVYPISFAWNFVPAAGGRESRFREKFEFSKEDYEAAQAIERHNDNYPKYVQDGRTYDVCFLARWFRERSEEFGLSVLDEASHVVAFVRSIVYESDEVTHGVEDYANYPIETLVEAEEGSDCEDHAILAAALLLQLGHKVALFYLEFADEGHLALGYGGVAESIGYGATAPSGEFYGYFETVPSPSDQTLGVICEEFMKQIRKATVLEV